jgi:hypothetical protein
MLQLSLSARAECMHDITVLLPDLLRTPAITRFLYSYSARCSQYGEGMLELVFRCPRDQRKDMKSTIERVIAHVQLRADNNDLHVLGQTLNFTDEFDGARADDDLKDRILPRFTDKLRPPPANCT